MFGRDLLPNEVDDMLRKLEDFYNVVETAEKELEFQMQETNKSVKDDLERKQNLEKQIADKREKLSKESSPSNMMKVLNLYKSPGIQHW